MSHAYGDCKACNRTMLMHGRMLCATCYARQQRNGTLHHYPRAYPNHRELLCSRCDEQIIWAAGMCRTCFNHYQTDGQIMREPRLNLPDRSFSHADWRNQANCLNVNPELFFTDIRGSQYPAEAIECCQNCPVRYSCLEDALQATAGDDFGLRGGLSERQRQSLRQSSRRVPA